MIHRIAALSVQWHITTDCPNRCRHCYMYDPATYQAEKQGELSDKDLIRALDSITAFEQKWDARVRDFAVTGGDPLMRPCWREFLEELRRRDKRVVMMGVPESLTEDNLDALARLGVTRFQLSLDGLEATHDHIRGGGSFKRTMAGLEKLRDRGIEPAVMFTLHGENRQELLPVLRHVADNSPAASFSFDILSAVGNARDLNMDLTPQRTLDLFSAYLEEKNRLRAEGNAIKVKEKPHLFNALRASRGEIAPAPTSVAPDVSGCLAGFTCACILADGSMPACRRFPLIAGKLPEQTFEEVFLGSNLLRKFRRPDAFQKCGNCEYFTLCRGCPAVTYGETGDPFAPFSLCFKDLLPKRPDVPDAPESPVARDAPFPASLPLNADFKEEHDLIARSFRNILASNLDNFINDLGALRGLMLLERPEERAEYARSPDAYLEKHGLALDGLKRCFVETFDWDIDEETREKVKLSIFKRIFS